MTQPSPAQANLLEVVAPARPAIVLLSGGLDSTTCLAIARHERFDPLYTLAFDYGQRHRHELTAAERISRHFAAAEHRVIRIDLRQFGGSALTADIPVPRDRDEAEMASSIPITYVPARNTIFLSYALAWAEVLECDDVFIGVNALDYSGYPDCRPQFIESFQQTARLGTKRSGFTIHAPLMQMTKAQIIRRGIELGVDYSMTHSCYDPDAAGRACGHCDSCLLRRRGFAAAGVPDPTIYR
ncbi:7-cyano-7-deazaguanine synthase QueC [Fontivita pretiosa]|uniref:7-cyano-7-deazaguanine synthase QueC n=1 Tax=Fontivita pretiosa TaxID=2989684 RepID=UPI003D16A7BB